MRRMSSSVGGRAIKVSRGSPLCMTHGGSKTHASRADGRELSELHEETKQIRAHPGLGDLPILDTEHVGAGDVIDVTVRCGTRRNSPSCVPEAVHLTAIRVSSDRESSTTA